jgi:hypothetical protein
MRTLIIVGTLLALSACGKSQTDTTSLANQVEVRNAAKPADAPVLAPVTAEAIPAAFQGRWGMVPADCTSTRGDAKGLLVIDAQSLRFYESRAVPKNIEVLNDNEWRADLHYSGEGQTWMEKTSIGLSNQGRTLTRMADGPWTYEKCAAS